jgi:hypothetical protein
VMWCIVGGYEGDADNGKTIHIESN